MPRSLGRNLCTFAALSAAGILAGCGRVTRQMHINSNPAGALVYLNGQEVGRTPCVVDFTWYGKYDLAVRKEGFSSLKRSQRVFAPWWQWVPLDLVADVTPGRKVDDRYYFYALKPLPEGGADPAALIQRANAMRPMLESGEFTRKPAPTPTTGPAANDAIEDPSAVSTDLPAIEPSSDKNP